jgi:hypothetical protein
MSAQEEYEKTLKPYSPESVKQGLAHPHLVEPANEKCTPVSRPTYPTITTKEG